MIYEDLTDNYLLGKMSKEEEQEFLFECKVNKTLKEEAIAMAYLIKGLNTLQEQLFLKLFLIFFIPMSSQIKLFKLLKSPDWDYEYLLELEEFKLKRMLKCFKKSRIIDTTFIIRDISICLKCLEIIQEKDKEFLEYLDSSFNSEKLFSLKLGKFSPYVNIRNERRFFRRNVIQKQIEDKEPYLGEEGRQYRILSLKVSLRQMKAFHLYNLIRTYKMQTWWE